MPLNVIFMGTSEFSLPTLEELIKNNFNILTIYTQPPKKSKRGQKLNSSPIEEFSRKKNLNLRSPSSLNNEEEFKVFKNLSSDLVVVVAYGQIIPKNFLKIPKFGFINIHASLLPRWRGAAPIQRAIMNGDRKRIMSIKGRTQIVTLWAMAEEIYEDYANSVVFIICLFKVIGSNLYLP